VGECAWGSGAAGNAAVGAQLLRSYYAPSDCPDRGLLITWRPDHTLADCPPPRPRAPQGVKQRATFTARLLEKEEEILAVEARMAAELARKLVRAGE
jgi:hypothetical protein